MSIGNPTTECECYQKRLTDDIAQLRQENKELKARAEKAEREVAHLQHDILMYELCGVRPNAF